jgi:ribosome-binding protein aMBF1 (putative translation factor)
MSTECEICGDEFDPEDAAQDVCDDCIMAENEEADDDYSMDSPEDPIYGV